jgi:GNAT superfamily N-acetyltransferase
MTKRLWAAETQTQAPTSEDWANAFDHFKRVEALPDDWKELMKAPVMGQDMPKPPVSPSDPNVCANCKGSGKKNFGVCNNCFGDGKVDPNDDPGNLSATDILNEVSKQDPNMTDEQVKPWSNRLERALYKEFMDWWPTSETAKHRSPETVTTNWSNFPNEPITHWLNVEDFLNERHPDAATGAAFGYEQANGLLERLFNNKAPDDDWLAEHGYIGTGNVKTQAMLNLHNKLQKRSWASDQDKQKYMELMLRHFGPAAQRLGRLVKACRRVASIRTAEASSYGLMQFFQWCTEKRLKPNRASLSLYAQEAGISLEEYQDISAFIASMGMDSQYLELAQTFTGRRMWDDGPYYAAGWDDEDDDDDDEPLHKHAMPAPAPEGLRFEPGQAHSNGIDRINAFVGDDHVGWLEWLADNNPWSMVTDRKPGEVSHIWVNPDQRRQSVATEMFDHVKKNVRPDLHHSPRRTDLGRMWVDHEEGRQKVAMPLPPPDGLHFKYHHDNESIPEGYSGAKQGGAHTFLAPAVAAYVDDNPVGYVEWWPGKNYPNAQQHYRHTMDRGKPGEVYYIYIKPELRRHNIATMMFDWAKQNAEPELHHSPKRSELGQKWVGYEEGRDGGGDLTKAASRRFYAMPWQDWSDKINSSPGSYFIDHGNKVQSKVTYQHSPKDGIHIDVIRTAPAFRGDGVAESMVRKMADDHPGVPIDFSSATTDGEAFRTRMVEKDPRFKKMVDDKSNIKEARRFWAVKITPPSPRPKITRHDYRRSNGLADEVLAQDGPAILWAALDSRFPGDKFYVARDKENKINGVLKGIESENHFHITDLYTGHEAPHGTGTHLLHTVAKDTQSRGKNLSVMNILNSARPYWEAMGAQTQHGQAHATWSPEGHQALINRDTLESPNTEGNENMMESVPHEWRTPGSARKIVDRRQRTARFWKEAMADTTQWHPLIRHDSRKSQVRNGYGNGKYVIRIPDKALAQGKAIGELSYSILPKGKTRIYPETYIDSIFVHPKHRSQGVAQALIERLNQDYPDHKINPGATTPEGLGFTHRLRETISDAENRISPDYKEHILDDRDTRQYNESQMNSLVHARLWKQAMPVGPIPEGTEFKYRKDFPLNSDGGYSPLGGSTKMPTVYAVNNYDVLGHITWKPDGEIRMIQVHPDFQRHGIGTRLFDEAKKYMPDIHHSPIKSDDGVAWSDYEKRREEYGPLPPLGFQKPERDDEDEDDYGYDDEEWYNDGER